MLGNAMWFGMVAQPSVPGVNILGVITVSWEEAAMALIINAATFPPVYLIVFLFKYSKPAKLRSNTIKKSLEPKPEEEESKDMVKAENDDEDMDDDMDDMDDMDDETEGKEIHEDTKSLVSIGSFCMFWFCIRSSSKCFRFELLGLLHLHHLHNCFSCQLCDQAQVLSSILLHLHWMVPELCPHCPLHILSVGFLYILWQ